MAEQFVHSLSLESLRNARDLHKRILFTLFAFLIFRVGTYIPLPGVNPEMFNEFMRTNGAGLLGFIDMFSGGAFMRMTVFALGISPYISASIIVQLVTKLVPKFEHLTKEGEQGRKKINTYTRYTTVVLSAVQGFGMAIFIEQMGGFFGLGTESVIINKWLFRLVTVLSLMGGTLFVMWLGEQITSRGIGNGSSAIIYAGILASLPSSLYNAFAMGREEGAYYIVPMILIVATIIFAYVIYMEKAQRRIPIQYPRRASTQNTNLPTHLPLKVNMAGVMPPIFAQTLLSIPLMTLGSFALIASNTYINAILNMIRPGNWVYVSLLVVLVVFFAFFYTNLTFNTTEMADNLKKAQAYVPGIRPGEQTATYLSYVTNRITVIGALYLISVCVIPQILQSHFNVPLSFSGTSILIIVNVTIDTISQIQTYLFAHQYKGLIKKGRR